MDELVDKLERLTRDAVERLDSLTYEKLEQFVLDREEIVNKLIDLGISSMELEMYRRRVLNLLSYDEAIMKKMKAFKNEAVEKLKKKTAASVQKSAYESNHPMESLFFDRKK